MTFGKRKPGTVTSCEGRSGERRATSFKGKIVTDSGQLIECTFAIVSASGALLVVPTVLGIPGEFELHGLVGGPRRVKVVRRAKRQVGVKCIGT
jgi:hypothetical protein